MTQLVKAEIPVMSLGGCVDYGKVLSLLQLQFPHMKLKKWKNMKLA
jgi:hypothetical protein